MAKTEDATLANISEEKVNPEKVTTEATTNQKVIKQTNLNEETSVVEILGTEEKNEADVQAISALIKAQRELGATVSENLNSGQYTWEDGRLTSIDWEYDKLKGDISFPLIHRD